MTSHNKEAKITGVYDSNMKTQHNKVWESNVNNSVKSIYSGNADIKLLRAPLQKSTKLRYSEIVSSNQ